MVVLGGELVKRTPHVVALIFFVSWRSELNGELAEYVAMAKRKSDSNKDDVFLP